MAERVAEGFMSIKVYNTIRFEITESIGLLTISRPKKLNALNQEVLTELKDLLTFIGEGKSGAKAIIVTGEGEKAFIAGADISEMSDMTPGQARAMSILGQEVTLLFEELAIPVVAAVNGFALGGGCEMAMSADFIVATKSAIFGQPEVKLGLIPGFGGTQRLARLVGRNLAKELIYTGRNISSEEALRAGLVLSVHDDITAMMKAAKSLIGQMLKNSPVAIAAAKKVMNDGNDLSLKESLEIEAEGFANIFNSNDMKEGTKAFIEKRAPSFPGK